MLMVQVQWFRIATRYGFELLQQFGERIKTKSKNVLMANFYVCRS